MGKEKQEKQPQLLPSSGTTVQEAVQSIINIYDKIKTVFPETEVRITCTSNIIMPLDQTGNMRT